ncbi:hypothetical protein [Rhodospirillum sp. A1_3_36]|uniref:hypothetical protein n=1 Tax=Rhodospirillum sp. A1_3_36 TaxID=3391666 RepID=UPI0039A6808B
MRFSRAAVLAACLALGAIATPVGVAGYPTQSIRIIVGFSAGSSIDGVARILGERLTDAQGQPVVEISG